MTGRLTTITPRGKLILCDSFSFQRTVNTANALPRLLEIADSFVESETLNRCRRNLPADRDASFLATNAALLAEARALVRRPCTVEVSIESRDWGLTFEPLTRLSTAFGLLHQAAARRQQWDVCTSITLDHLRLADGFRRGGIVIHALTAHICESGAVNALRRIRRQLPAELAIDSAAEILQSEAEREPYAAIEVRDDEWERCAVYDKAPTLPAFEPTQWSAEDIAEYGLDQLQEMDRSISEFMNAMASLPPKSTKTNYAAFDFANLSLRRLLAVELAAQAYHRTYGRYPRSVAELCPNFLPYPPLDPFSGRPFRVRQTPAFAAYSLAIAGQDFAGVLGSLSECLQGRCNLGVDCFEFKSDQRDAPRPQVRLSRWTSIFRVWFPQRVTPA